VGGSKIVLRKIDVNLQVTGEVGASFFIAETFLYSGFVGVRLASNDPRATAFIQLLAGVTWIDGLSVFAIQPGGGVDIRVTPSAKVRVEIDLSPSRPYQSYWRFGVGVVLPVRK
jgi:hypothetical protein